MNRKIMLIGAVATLFVVAVFSLWLLVLRGESRENDKLTIYPEMTEAPVITETPVDWGSDNLTEEISITKGDNQDEHTNLADMRLIEQDGSNIGVVLGLDYQVYYNEGTNVLSYNIFNHGAEFIAFDSIVVLADRDKLPKYAFYIHSMLHPPIGKSQFYEAYPEIPFEDVEYVGVVSAYNESMFKEANELVEETYFAHFDPLVVGAVDITKFNRGQQRTSSQWSSIDWSRLPTTRQNELIQLELDLMENLTLEELLATLNDMFGGVLGTGNDTPDAGIPIETPEDLQEVVDELSNGMYDLQLHPEIVVHGIKFSEFLWSPITKQYTVRLDNISNESCRLTASIEFYNDDWVKLASITIGPSMPSKDSFVNEQFTALNDLSYARYIKIVSLD